VEPESQGAMLIFGGDSVLYIMPALWSRSRKEPFSFLAETVLCIYVGVMEPESQGAMYIFGGESALCTLALWSRSRNEPCSFFMETLLGTRRLRL
jgi:hypothetical protein